MILAEVGEIDVPRYTRGLDLVLDMGFCLPPGLPIFSVEECLTLLACSSTGRHLFCINDNSAIADIGSKVLCNSGGDTMEGVVVATPVTAL